MRSPASSHLPPWRERLGLADTQLAAALESSNFPRAMASLIDGANPRLVLDSGDRPLHIAAARLRFESPEAFDRNAAELVDLLLSLGAPVDELSTSGVTPLAFASRGNQPERARALLRAGADPNRLDPEGFRPLDYAAINHNIRLASVLLEAGADPALCFEHSNPGSYGALLKSSPVPAFAAAWRERQLLERVSPAARPSRSRGPL